jgi:hypothetical protein
MTIPLSDGSFNKVAEMPIAGLATTNKGPGHLDEIEGVQQATT